MAAQAGRHDPAAVGLQRLEFAGIEQVDVAIGGERGVDRDAEQTPVTECVDLATKIEDLAMGLLPWLDELNGPHASP